MTRSLSPPRRRTAALKRYVETCRKGSSVSGLSSPSLIRELGADPAEIAASVGLDLAALQDPENSIPFSAAGKL